jgi:hypothetical protein
MVRDFEKVNKDKANGSKGGNPKLNGGVNPEVKAQKLEARIQKEEDIRLVADATQTSVKVGYSREFEAFWIDYPRTPTMSKKEAWAAWKKLTPQKREDACQAIGPYRDSMRGKEQFILHACRFLNREVFEGFVANGTTIAPVFDIRGHLS